MKTAVLALAAAFAASPAFAWQTTVEGPDVFGVTKVFAGTGGREALIVQCDSDEKLALAVIYPKKPFEEVDEYPVTLLLRGASAQPIELTASRREWNDNYGGFVASGRTPDIRAAIEEIRDAGSRIQVGVLVADNRFSAEFSARGSTAAMAKVIKHCGIADIEAPPA